VPSCSGIKPSIITALLLAAPWAAPTHSQETPPATATTRPWTIPSNDDIRKLLAERVGDNGVGMVVGVIEPAGRRIVTYGRSDADNGRALDGDTVFEIGSLTKTFTTLVFADMVRRGEVQLEDSASNYLPAGVRMPARGRPITLLDLATHRSGLPSMPNNVPLQGQPNPIEAYTVDQLYSFLSGYTLERAPGEKWAYSNLGVALLGRLLARQAGVEYEELVTQRVLKPLRMSSTSITLTPAQSARLAPGHDRYLRRVASWEMRAMPGSGSLRSTANDMLRLIAAQLGYRDTPLSPAMAYQRTVRITENETQRLGWFATKRGDEEIFAHEGGKAGYRSAVAFNLRTRTGIVVLANARTDDRPDPIALHLLTGAVLLPAPPAPPQVKTATLDRKLLDRYAGRYELRPGRILTVVRYDDHLLIDANGDGGMEFVPVSERDFFMSSGKDEITFESGADGRVTGLLLYGDGKRAGSARLAPRIGAEGL
jgi:CubicO group peptidase (beta-lactamase class C family)